MEPQMSMAIVNSGGPVAPEPASTAPSTGTTPGFSGDGQGFTQVMGDVAGAPGVSPVGSTDQMLAPIPTTAGAMSPGWWPAGWPGTGTSASATGKSGAPTSTLNGGALGPNAALDPLMAGLSAGTSGLPIVAPSSTGSNSTHHDTSLQPFYGQIPLMISLPFQPMTTGSALPLPPTPAIPGASGRSGAYGEAVAGSGGPSGGQPGAGWPVASATSGALLVAGGAGAQSTPAFPAAPTFPAALDLPALALPPGPNVAAVVAGVPGATGQQRARDAPSSAATGVVDATALGGRSGGVTAPVALAMTVGQTALAPPVAGQVQLAAGQTPGLTAPVAPMFTGPASAFGGSAGTGVSGAASASLGSNQIGNDPASPLSTLLAAGAANTDASSGMSGDTSASSSRAKGATTHLGPLLSSDASRPQQVTIGLSTAPTPTTASTDGVSGNVGDTGADPLTQMIVHQAVLLQRGDSTEMRLRLSPPALGQIQVTIRRDAQGALSAQLTPSTHAAAALLTAHQQTIRDALAAHSTTGDASVMVTADGSGGGSGTGGRSSAGRDGSGGSQSEYQPEPSATAIGGITQQTGRSAGWPVGWPGASATSVPSATGVPVGQPTTIPGAGVLGSASESAGTASPVAAPGQPAAPGHPVNYNA